MEFINEIWLGALNSSGLEITGVVFGLLSVWLARQESVWLYPVGLVSTVIYIYLCWDSKLYADMGINMYYSLISVYGWFYWSKGTQTKAVPITRLSASEKRSALILFLLSWLTIYFVLNNFTDTDVAFFDSTTTAIFIISMIWMARKKIEHWIGWVIGDVLSIPLYMYKGLEFTSVQFLVFTLLAISGYMQWKKKLSP